MQIPASLDYTSACCSCADNACTAHIHNAHTNARTSVNANTIWHPHNVILTCFLFGAYPKVGKVEFGQLELGKECRYTGGCGSVSCAARVHRQTACIRTDNQGMHAHTCIHRHSNQLHVLLCQFMFIDTTISYTCHCDQLHVSL